MLSNTNVKNCRFYAKFTPILVIVWIYVIIMEMYKIFNRCLKTFCEGEAIMKKKKVLSAIQIIPLALAILVGAGYLHLYNHGLSGKTLKSICVRLPRLFLDGQT